MVSKTPTPVLVDTAILSRIVSDVLDLLEVPSSRKSVCLNTVAARIAGPDKNWGFLTGRQAPVIARGLSGVDIVRRTAGDAPAPADTRPEAPEAIPAQDMARTIRAAIESGATLVIASAPPGLGLSAIASEVAVEVAGLLDRPRRALAVGRLHGDEEIERDLRGRSGLREDLRPLTEAGAVTIYEGAEGFGDAGLAALEAELRDLALRHPAAQVVLTTNAPDTLCERLRQAAPWILDRATKLHFRAPTIRISL